MTMARYKTKSYTSDYSFNIKEVERIAKILGGKVEYITVKDRT